MNYADLGTSCVRCRTSGLPLPAQTPALLAASNRAAMVRQAPAYLAFAGAGGLLGSLLLGTFGAILGVGVGIATNYGRIHMPFTK